MCACCVSALHHPSVTRESLLHKHAVATAPVSVSYLELYNEMVNDLLEPSNTNLKIRTSPNQVDIHPRHTHTSILTPTPPRASRYVLTHSYVRTRYKHTNTHALAAQGIYVDKLSRESVTQVRPVDKRASKLV